MDYPIEQSGLNERGEYAVGALRIAPTSRWIAIDKDNYPVKPEPFKGTREQAEAAAREHIEACGRAHLPYARLACVVPFGSVRVVWAERHSGTRWHIFPK
jgi:hypothetical protein